jgi:hypothetical protein
LEFPDTGDHYVWNKAGCWVHNIVLGNPWAEWHGKVAVVNLRTGDTARVRLPKCNKMPGRRGFVTGAVVAGGSGRLAYSLQVTTSRDYPLSRNALDIFMTALLYIDNVALAHFSSVSFSKLVVHFGIHE